MNNILLMMQNDIFISVTCIADAYHTNLQSITRISGNTRHITLRKFYQESCPNFSLNVHSSIESNCPSW